MQNTIKSLIEQALDQVSKTLSTPLDVPAIQVDRTKDVAHGDFASNIALLLAKQVGMPPRQLAETIVKHLPSHPGVEKTEIAGPGFINFYLNKTAALQIIADILKQGVQFGHSQKGKGQKVLIEFVSANPTGPLHVGHGRGAAYGATVADLLAAIGYDVQREYYVNDAGRQMDILATSIWLRYLEALGESFTFPSNAYRGDYLQPMIETIQQKFGREFYFSADQVFANVPADEPAGGDKEEHIDALIVNAKHLLKEHYQTIFSLGLTSILDDIREDLAEFGVYFDTWFSERQLVEEGSVEKALKQLDKAGYLYQKEGAIWFRSTDFGDDKDRVVKRDNGQPTYFAGDIAYHFNKVQRGFNQLIDIFGADHHGYIARLRAILQAFDYDNNNVSVLLVQFAILYRQGQRVQMSTRSGSFVTLRELREEVGNDAARFFYITRKADQHLDFDLDLAKAHSQDNPLYYIQYAYARICKVFTQLAPKKWEFDQALGLTHLNLLVEPHEQALLRRLPQYAEVVELAAMEHEPHRLATYLRELATDLHSYYNAHIFLVEESPLRNARLALIKATGQILSNGLQLLGVSAPEQM